MIDFIMESENKYIIVDSVNQKLGEISYFEDVRRWQLSEWLPNELTEQQFKELANFTIDLNGEML